ncbi:MAG TPA: SCO5389 family protein [Jatrophihabitantaceae bacterium]|jgi:hypothetical protein
MSLTVTPELVAAAQQGQLDDAAFIDCVRTSLPYAYGVVAGLAGRVPAGGVADNQVAPPDDRTQGELLRAMASTSIRGALERHFGVRIAFQNCHRVAVFAPGAPGYDEFTSTAAQVLNQKPELVNC